jgi:sensor histidine kinase YesM
MPFPKALGILGLTALFCVLVGALLSLAVPGLGSFGRNVLFSECIGLAIVGWALLLRRLAGRQRLGGGLPLLIGALALVLGYASGYSLAYTLVGEPIRLVSWGSERLLVIFATLLASAFIGYLLKIRNELAREAAARSDAQRLAAEAQLRLLRAQLDPHMRFNTLANLRSLVDDEPEQAQRMIDQLITYLRAALAASRSESTTLRQEYAQLRAYLEIMALRMGPRPSYALALPEAMQQTAVPPMLLQPLVENAIRHGLEPKIGAGRIDVRATQAETGVEICVTDNGLGLPPDDAPEPTTSASGSYGVVHVRERLHAVYGGRASLTLMRHEPQGVRACVRIPR